MMKRLACVLGVLLVATATTAMADSGGFGLGIGSVKAKDAEGADMWLTVNLRTMLGDTLALEPELGWYRAGLSGARKDVFNGGGSLLAIIPIQSKLDVFGGGGLGAHMYRHTGGAGNTTRLGYHFLGGIDLNATDALAFFGAGRYEIVKFPDVSVKQWKFYAGIRFRSH